MLLIWLFSSLGIFQARADSTSRSSPFFESDYLEIVKDVPADFGIGRKYGYMKYRRLAVHGPNSFPVITDNKEGYSYVAAGRYGKVVIAYWLIT